MKRITKDLTIFIIFVLYLIFVCPMNIDALTKKTDYVSINKSTSIIIDKLSFNELKFETSSEGPTLSFGISGLIDNKNHDNTNYTSKIAYYDKDRNLLYETTNSALALTNSSKFEQISNIASIGEQKYKKIEYYRITITTSKEEQKTPSEISKYNNYPYVIDKYNADIKVNENNTLDITETIVVYFNENRYGIYKIIPLRNKITKTDGNKTTIKAKVYNVKVNEKYITSKENNNYKIQIGDEKSKKTGEQTYIINYTYDLGKDKLKNYDELYFDIINSNWDTIIGNISFYITMPKDFDANKINFLVNGESKDDENLNYTVLNNTIKGTYGGVLEKKENLTIKCELEEGYFSEAKYNISIIDILIFAIPVLSLIISFLLWYKFGKDEKVIKTIEYYPPEGYNSLEAGFLYKGEATKQDITSLLIYLANKGYIKIKETEEKFLFTTAKGYTITKIKEYDGSDEDEAMFLKGLFMMKETSTSLFKEDGALIEVNEITSKDIYNNFSITMNEILNNINSSKNKNEIFEPKATHKKIFVILMIIATYCTMTIPSMIYYSSFNNMAIALIFPCIGFTVLFSTIFDYKKTYINGKPTNQTFRTVVIGLITGLCFGVLPLSFIVLPVLLDNIIFLTGYLTGLVCVLGMIVFLKYLPKRTKYGNKILGELMGFKKFLENIEEDKIKEITEIDPTYYYNILPYAYVLGISDKWIKKFEAIVTKPPIWYEKENDFDINLFNIFIDNIMSSAQNSLPSENINKKYH